MEKNNKIIMGLVIFILLGLGVVFNFWLAPKIFLTQVDSAHKIVEKTYDAENAIYNYEWFKTQYEKIKASERQIDNLMMEVDDFKDLYGAPSTWDFTTKQEYNRLRTTLTGLKNHYESQVADYNARSQMANRNIFKGSLPYNVDKKIW